MSQPLTLIIRTAGTNCDRELAHAFELAGATTQTIHLNQLIDDPSWFERADLVGFPGGFSYGDDIAAGRIFANRLRHRLLDPIRHAIERGVPMIGICNGFQVLVKLGLLPQPLGEQGGRQTVTLADNTSGRFIDRWVSLQVPADTRCIWTRGLADMQLPIAHGEGRFVAENDDLIATLQSQGQVAVRYAADDNPNGSTADIAGICDPSGLIFGLMPHPERFIHATNSPGWTRLSPDQLGQTPAGLRFFQNAVEHVLAVQTATVVS